MTSTKTNPLKFNEWTDNIYLQCNVIPIVIDAIQDTTIEE